MVSKLSKTACVLLIVATFVFSVCGCALKVDGVDVSDYTGVQYTTYEYFNTNCTVSCYLPAERADEFKSLWDNEINSVLEEVSSVLSVDDENSDIRAFNEAEAGSETEIGQITYEALTLAKKAYEDTGGAFNPALALSIDLWGFSARFNEKDYVPTEPYDRADYRTQLPSEEYVEAFLKLSDFSETQIYEKDGRYFVKKSGSEETVQGRTYTQRLDLSGIGKGYCADLISKILRENGFYFGYADIGSSSMSLMKNARKEIGAKTGEWAVSVLSPTESGKYYYKAYVKDSSLATSGSYQQYYEIDGVRYSHIIDPFTGRPYDSEVLTATVYGENAALCDAYSTAMCVLGKDKALELASRLNGYTYTMAVKNKNGFDVFANVGGKQV